MEASYKIVPGVVFGYHLTNRKWESVTLPETGFGTFMTQYHHLEVGVTDASGKPYTFLPYKYANVLLPFTGSLQEWLDSMAGVAILTLKPGLPELVFDGAHYQPINYDLDAQIAIAPPNTHPTQDFSVDDASDLIVMVPSEHLDQYANNVMYSVEGIWVAHKSEGYGTRLIGGGDIIRHSGGSNVGGLVLNGIGSVRTKLFSELSVLKVDVSRDMYTSMLIKSDVSLSGKTVGIVIGGVLTWLKPEQYVSDSTITFNVTNEILLTRLIETQDKFDWDVLGLGDFSSSTNVAAIRNDATIKGLLEHVSSFLVVIDNPYVEVDYTPITGKGVPGRYYLEDAMRSKLLGYTTNHVGLGVEVWPVWEDGMWTLNSVEFSKVNHLYTQSKWKKQQVINDARAHVLPYIEPELTMVNLKARRKDIDDAESWRDGGAFDYIHAGTATASARKIPLYGSNSTDEHLMAYMTQGQGCTVGSLYYPSPYYADYLTEFDVESGTRTEYKTDLLHLRGHNCWGMFTWGTKVILTPYASADVIAFDTVTKEFSVIATVNPSHRHAWSGGALGSNGKFYFMPSGVDYILEVEPLSGTTRNIPLPVPKDVGFYCGGTVAADNGKIYSIPRSGSKVLVYNPQNDVVTTIDVPVGPKKWFLGCFYEGKIYCGVETSTQSLVIDTETDTIKLIGGFPGKMCYGPAAANGRVYYPSFDGNIYIYDIALETLTSIHNPVPRVSGPVLINDMIYASSVTPSGGLLEIRPE